MLARRATRSDVGALPGLIQRETKAHPEHDSIYVVGKLGIPEGVLVSRPCTFVHELVIRPDCIAHWRADALANFAISDTIGREARLQTALFLIHQGNDRMRRFVEGLGAIQESEPGDLLYALTP